MSAFESQVYLAIFATTLFICSCVFVYHIKRATKLRRNNKIVQDILDQRNFSESYEQTDYDPETDIIIMSKPSKKEMIDKIVSVGLKIDERTNAYKPTKRESKHSISRT